MVSKQKGLNITKRNDLYVCIGIALLGRTLERAGYSWFSRAAVRASNWASLGCIVAYCTGQYYNKLDEKGPILQSWSYSAATTFLQHAAYNYFYHETRTLPGLAVVYFLTNFATECAVRKFAGYKYSKDQHFNLLKHSALSASVTMGGIIAGELVTYALGVNDEGQGIIRNLAYAAIRYIADAEARHVLGGYRNKKYNENKDLDFWEITTFQ